MRLRYWPFVVMVMSLGILIIGPHLGELEPYSMQTTRLLVFRSTRHSENVETPELREIQQATQQGLTQIKNVQERHARTQLFQWNPNLNNTQVNPAGLLKAFQESEKQDREALDAAWQALQTTQSNIDAMARERTQIQSADLQTMSALVFRLLLSASLAACALVVILNRKRTPTEKHWAYGMVGTLLGYWFKG